MSKALAHSGETSLVDEAPSQEEREFLDQVTLDGSPLVILGTGLDEAAGDAHECDYVWMISTTEAGNALLDAPNEW